MAHVIPATISEETLSEAEKETYTKLKNSLADRFTVFHSMDVLSRNMHGKLIDGEVDFVLFSRNNGLLTLEVKGGAIRYDGQMGLQGEVSLASLRRRLAERWGDRSLMPQATRKVVRSMVAWGVLRDIKPSLYLGRDRPVHVGRRLGHSAVTLLVACGIMLDHNDRPSGG